MKYLLQTWFYYTLKKKHIPASEETSSTFAATKWFKKCINLLYSMIRNGNWLITFTQNKSFLIAWGLIIHSLDGLTFLHLIS